METWNAVCVIFIQIAILRFPLNNNNQRQELQITFPNASDINKNSNLNMDGIEKLF